MRFWLESGKNIQEYVHFLYLFKYMQMFPVFFVVFFNGDINCWERAGQRNIGPHISPLHGLWTAGLESSN